MTIICPLTLPARTPSSWELKLPGYPVITNAWRSASFPELLGSLPSEAEWTLTFENQTSDEALALLLPWNATGGGQWPLAALPDELAGGVDDDDFRKRLIGTTWTIAQKPRKESVKNGRFNVTVDLVYELTFTSHYGPRNPMPSGALYITTLDGKVITALNGQKLITQRCVSVTPIAALDGVILQTLDGKAIVIQ